MNEMNECTLLRCDDPRAITCLMLGEKGTSSARLVPSTKEAELNSHKDESNGSTPEETQTGHFSPQDEESNCVKQSSSAPTVDRLISLKQSGTHDSYV